MKVIQLNNDKAFPQQIDHDHFQGILTSINSSKSNALEDIEWEFVNVKVNFSVVESLKASYPFLDKDENVNPVWLAKVLFLSAMEGLNADRSIRIIFDSIVKTFFFMVDNNIHIIDKSRLQEYIIYGLMHGVDNNGVYARLEPISYQLFMRGITPIKWHFFIKEHSLPQVGFVGNFANVFIKELKSAIESLSAGDLTYRDWKEGGSFNYLTLDYGKYYVEHCDDFFQKNINIAIALQYTINNAVSIARQAGYKVSERDVPRDITPCINHFLSGKQVCDLKEVYFSHRNQSWWHELKKCTFEFFQIMLGILSIVEKLTAEDFINELSSLNGIETPNDFQKQWLEVLVEAECDIRFDASPTQLIKLSKKEIECIKEVVGSEIDVDKTRLLIQQEIDNCKARICNDTFLPTLDFYKENGIEEKGVTSTIVYNFLKSVENSGITSFVSLVGWRESEYGFSLNNISININRDLLDQYLYPTRYIVKWVVPKTNGKTELEREILRSAYRRAVKLSIFIGAANDDPCLYSFHGNKKDRTKSNNIIKSSIGSMWPHFVKNYIPFKQLALIEERECLINKEHRNCFDNDKLAELSTRYLNEGWEILEKNRLLTEAYQKAITEFERVKFFLNTDDRRGVVWDYKQGTIKPEHKILFDTYLSDEKKQAISDLQSKDQVNSEFTRIIISEIIADCLYPTPHAIRHMWAESVYRRFDGDVGWMIRSNFKHISQYMWLAYIRNKENSKLNQRVKKKVISSLLKNYIRKRERDNQGNVGEFGDDYAGAMSKMLSRLLRNTKTWSIDKLDEAIDHFALTEIEDIKSNPWGFCILKKRHQDKANCAELGIPQRQNASPAFCLSCQNNLTQSGNVDGILLGIANDIKVIGNPRVPDNFRRASYATVKNALIHLKKLKADNGIISTVQAALAKANGIQLTMQNCEDKVDPLKG
jgi:hypothetical protein